jgi:NitT/TauT family transport system permease protein
VTDAALSTTAAAAAPAGPVAGSLRRARAQRGAMAVGALVLLCLAWEGYKLLAPDAGVRVLGAPVLPRADDISMPHVWTVLGRLGQPELGVAGSQPVGEAVLAAMWFSLRVAMAGLALGVLVGGVLAVAMQRFRVVERGLLPYVVASQTVPLVALAPLVASWGGQLHLGSLDWQPWMSVSLIAAYLAFFPVAVGMLRGLQSPPEASVELMRSYAATEWQTLWRLRMPAAMPLLMPALRLAAAAAVVGAVVAEISTGTRGGIGRLIIAYSQGASSDPAKLYDAVSGAAALGLLVAGLVALIEMLAARGPGASREASR